ncbi:MAG: MotA/TolQ/ExbB proton channel family protein [Planctomycetes bacterium]|nr:MotA/TolQ/ExbB proton channel family protein [Planctomycetota bacterium]
MIQLLIITPLAQAANHPPETFFEIVFSGGPVGIAIMVLIILCSIAALALSVEQLLTLRASVLMPEGLREGVQQQLAAGNLKGAFQACDAQPSFLAFLIRTSLSEAESGWTAVEKALEDAAAEQTARLMRRVEYLAVIGNIAPMLGLLGTVVGLLFAFHEVASTQGVARAADLADGIYHALVSTVGGLIVAIPAMAVYAAFRNRVDQLAAEAAYTALHALAPVKRILVSTRPSPSTTPPPAGTR